MAEEHLVLKPENWANVGRMVVDLCDGKISGLPDNSYGNRGNRLAFLNYHKIKCEPMVVDVCFHRCTQESMHLMLPPPKSMLAAYDDVVTNNRYELPTQYEDFLQGRIKAEDFFFFRVGEYTLQHCR